jgi:hypothetical protein
MVSIMLNLKNKFDEMSYRLVYKRENFLIGIVGFICLITIMNEIFLVVSKRDLIYGNPCRILPTTAEDYRQGMREALNDFDSNGEYHNSHHGFIGETGSNILSFLYGFWSFVSPLLLPVFLGLPMPYFSLFWLSTRWSFTAYLFENVLFQDSIKERGYDNTFTLACLRDNSKPGCHNAWIADKLKKSTQEKLEEIGISLCTKDEGVSRQGISSNTMYEANLRISIFVFLALLACNFVVRRANIIDNKMNMALDRLHQNLRNTAQASTFWEERQAQGSFARQRQLSSRFLAER